MSSIKQQLTAVEFRQHDLYARLREFETKYREAKQIAIGYRNAVHEIRTRLHELEQVEKLLNAGRNPLEVMADGDEQLAENTNQFANLAASDMIMTALTCSDELEGLTLDQLSKLLPTIKRQLISSTLHSLKKTQSCCSHGINWTLSADPK